MSAKCNFSLKYLPLAYSVWMQVEKSKDAMTQWINETFDKAPVDEIIRLIDGEDPGSGSSPGKSNEIKVPSLARPIISSEEDEVSIDSLFIGRSDLRMQMEQQFTEDIVARTVFNLSANNGKGEFLDFSKKDEETGISIGNKNIMLYKNQLIKDLYDEMGETAPVLTADMSAREYDGTIKEALRKYRNYIADKDVVKFYNSFAILQNFDSLLKSKADYITFNEEMVLDFADKYDYKGPNVEHYTGFMSSESAQIENQESNLAKILLSVIPEVNAEGDPISGSFIGLSGFNSVMTSLKKALLYSPKSFNENTRRTYYDGLAINMNGIIEDYIKLLASPNSTLPENHRNFLISKLRGIQKYIYQSELDQDIKDMFTQMFFKTEPTSYRSYTYDPDLEEMSGRNLASNVSNNQKYALEDAIRGAAYLLWTNSTAKKELKDAYKIKASGSKVTLVLNEITNQTITFDLGTNRNKFVCSGNINNKQLNKLVLDVLGIIIPDTYESVGTQIDGKDGFSLINDFATPLGAVLCSVFGTGVPTKTTNIVDLKNYSQSLLTTAKKFGVIYGDETKNVVKSPGGNNLPVYQLTNMTYNTMSILDDIKKWIPTNEGHTNPYADSLFIENGELLTAPQIRNEVRIGVNVKSPADLSVKELLQLSVVEDFYSPFVRDKVIYLQNATFADKSTHYLIGYDTTKTNFGLDKEIASIIKGESSDNLIEVVRMYRARRLEKIAANIVSDYKKAFLLNGKVIDRTVYTGFDENIDFNTLDGWDQFLKTAKLINEDRSLTIDDVERVFHDAALEFKPEVHAYKPQKDVQSVIGKVRINETLLRQLHSSTSGNAFKLRVNNARKQFIKSIEDNNWKWNKYDNPKMKKIWDDYQGKLGKEWFDTNSGDMYLTRNGKLHPILEAYFVTNMLLSNEYNAVTIGEVWAHPNKNKVLTNNDPEKGETGTYSEFSEANRLIAQIKRSVAFGATYHPFAQNKNNGVTSDIDIAVMEDMPAFVQTPNGVESEVDSMDGSGIADALEARFENNSLIDARVGDNKKTIMMDVDKTYGTPILLKWAVYALTNEVRRNSYVSDASGEQLCGKMRSKYIRIIDNIGDYYNQKQDKIIYEDINTGIRYKILSVGYDAVARSYYRGIIQVDEKGNEVGNAHPEYITDFGINQNTLYALDQLFGGAWTCKYENGAWNYTEENNDVLEEILSRKENQDLKKGFIAYAVNKSAIKVGAGEINKEGAWKDDSILRTIRMSTKYGGVQMDADHELDLAQVTEMTQMISALIEDQHYSDLVKDVYEDIGKVVVAHMKKYDDKLQILKDPNATPEQKEEAKKRLYRILGESLVVAFSSGSKDTLGLAQAFVAKAAEAIKKNEDFQMPFSGATINGAFISQIASDINRGGIRHKYEGFAGVLNPSYNMIQYFRVYNDATGQYENMMLPQLASKMREYNKTHLTEWTIEDITTNHGIQLSPDGLVYSTNPFVKETNVAEIDFEDTIIVVNNGIVEEPIHIDSFAKYDDLKNRLHNDPSLQVFSWMSKGRNLRGADTRFTINGIEYSYYDLDSVRTSFYLTRYIKDPNSLTEDQKEFLNTIIGFNWEQNTFDKLISERNRTQRTLKAIETGKEFFFNTERVRATSWRTRPPEIITGRYQAEKFGLTSNDHINNITSKDYFITTLNAKYSGKKDTTVPDSIYDVILYSGDKKFYVKIGNVESAYSKVEGLSSNPDFAINGDSVWYDNEEIASSTGKSFKTYTDETGQQYNLIAVDSIDRYNELMKSGIFDRQMIDYNAREDNLSMLMDIFDIEADSVDDFDEKAEIRKDRNIQRKAERMFKSFKQSLLYVGARIPTQAMQSFMPMETIAWVNTDKNVVYVPAMQTYLEGSDYDIDKLYIMAHSVDSNGFVSSGSSLENYFSLDVTSRVSKPNGVKYNEGPGVQVTTTELQQVIGNRKINTIDAINLLNRIYNSGINTIEFVDDGTEPIDPRQFERDKKKFLRIINSHSDPDRDVKGNTLKNRLVNAIYNIASKPQNQLIAQVPVDMGEPQDAAKASTLGRAEMHINSDNPETIFMMQVQNMVGKKVIGISAVALKGFFAMSYVYSRKKEALKEAIFKGGNNLEIMQKIAALLITNPLTNEVTSIANLDVEDILDDLPNTRMLTFDEQEVQQIPDVVWGLFKRDYVGGRLVINLYDGLDVLRERVNRTDAALVISSIVSAATDNAKELILAKINATPELVDIYTTLTAIGVKFSDIANLMTSDELQFITKLGESSIFDESTERFSVKDAIKFYTGQGMLKVMDREAIAAFITRTYDKEHPEDPGVGNGVISNENLLQTLQNDDIVKAIINRTNKYIATYDSKKAMVDSARESEWNDEKELRIANGERVPDFDFKFLPISKERARNVVKFLELVHRRNEFRASHPDSNIDSLLQILPTVEEFGDFSRMLGINQGLPTTLYKLRSMAKKLDDVRKHQIVTFDTESALEQLPHFSRMLQTIDSIWEMVNEFSVKAKTALSLADAVEQECSKDQNFEVKLSEEEFNALYDYVGDLLIARFLKESGFEFWVMPDAYMIDKYTGEANLPEQLRRIKLDSNDNIEAFKRWMDSYVIPNLKKKYPNNAFIAALRPMANAITKNGSTKIVTGWRLPLQMMDIDKSPNTIQLYSEILAGFDEIANQEAGVYGQNIGDLFYVYNMLVNKDSYGQHSLTRIFENLVQVNRDTIANRYNNWLSIIDYNGLIPGETVDGYGTLSELGGSTREARYRINNAVPNSNVKSTISGNSDAVLDLPIFYNIPIVPLITEEEIEARKPKVEPAFKYNTDAQSIVIELSKRIQSVLGENTVHLITSDELEEIAESPEQLLSMQESKGFIHNGEIYINVSKFDKSNDIDTSGTMFHEFAHILFAVMKNSRNSEIRDVYYKAISMVKDSSEFEAIASHYPDLVGSDLYEEVFVNMLELYLKGKTYITLEGDIKPTLSGFLTANETTFVDTISFLLGLDKGYVKSIKAVQGQTLEDVMTKFGFMLLHNEIQINKTTVIDSQKQSTIKQNLYEDNKLTMKCENE